jgi:predicted ATPase
VTDTETTRRPGDWVGPYALVRPLGVGGSGEVWEAVLHGPAGFRKPVALKLLLGAREADRHEQQRLIREARLGGLLQHPHVVGTFGLTVADGVWAVALELVRGPTVLELVQRRGALPARAVLDVGVQAASGLAYIHELVVDGVPAGLVHRDLKPANLLVDATGTVKVADLGISLQAGEAGRAAGTAGYMAPEQAADAACPASDQFGLGAVLYVLATGQRPFGTGAEARSALASVEARLDDPAFLAPVERAVAGLGAVVYRCLRADPSARWPSMRALAAVLAALRARQAEGDGLRAVLASLEPDGAGADLAPPPDPVTPPLAGFLPTSRDRFVGRGTELASLLTGLQGGRDRWLSVIGPGGMGKSRLALEVARAMRSTTPGGTWWVALGDARTADEVAAAVAGALGIDGGAGDPVAAVGRALAGRERTLLALDGAEGARGVLGDTVGRWLDQAPQLRVLLTSRVSTGLRGERQLVLDGLRPVDAVALLEDRAGPLAPADRDAALALAGSLEGMPLAIELAAARVQLLGVDGVRARLSLALLSGGRGDRPERHRSVAAALEGSWSMLAPAATEALGALSVFEGPFGLEAAESVLGTAEGPPVLDLLDELVQASLVRVQAGAFAVPALVRAFAAQAAAPEVRARAEARHGAHVAQWGAPEALDALDGIAGAAQRTRLLAARSDVLAACKRAIGRGDAPVAVATLRAVWAVLALQGPAALALGLAEEVCALPALPTEALAQAAVIAAMAAEQSGRIAVAGQWAGRSRDAALAVGDRATEASAIGVAARLAYLRGDVAAARAGFEAAFLVRRALGDRRAEAMLLGNLALLDQECGRHEAASTSFLAALAAHREVGNRRSEAILLGNLAQLRQEQGRLVEARALLDEALGLHRAVGNRRSEGLAWTHLGWIHLDQGRFDDAETALRRGLALGREVGHPGHAAVAACGLGDLALARGRLAQAQAHYDEAGQASREAGGGRVEVAVAIGLGILHARRGETDAARVRLVRAQELAATRRDPLLEGEALAQLGGVLAEAGDPEASTRAFAEAEARLRPLGPGVALGRLLALRAAWGRPGDRDGATRDLAEAEALAASIEVGGASELGRLIAEARVALAARQDPPAAAG